MENNQTSNTDREGLSNAKNVAKTGADVAKAGAKLGKDIAKKGAKTAIRDLIFGGLNPMTLAIFGGVLAAIILITLILSLCGANGFFSFEDLTREEKVTMILQRGFNNVKKDSKSFFKDYVNNKYNCKATNNDITFTDDGNFTVETDYCVLDIKFNPELLEFAQRIDSYANAAISTIQLFEEDENSTNITENEDQDFKEPLTEFDEEGNVITTEYGQYNIDKYTIFNVVYDDYGNSYPIGGEYVDNNSSAYYQTLAVHSYYFFDVSKNEEEYEFKNMHMTKLKHEKKTCYVYKDYVAQSFYSELIKSKIQVSCGDEYDVMETSYYYTDAQAGTIEVPMNCDPTIYKANKIEQTKQDLVGAEMYLPKDDDHKEYETRTIKDYNEASYLVRNTLADYELGYLLNFYKGGTTFGYGYSGFITSNGWNYSNTIDLDFGSLANAFWAYSNRLNSILHNLIYATDSEARGPTMTKQCTQFSGTFFYDVYGFAALRGNGNAQADYLLKDCGENSSCPTKFIQSATPAPGAIVSLYPNHVIVVNAVDDDGSVYISEGNLKNHGIRTNVKFASLQDYAQQMQMTIKTIAIPIKEDE